MIPMRLMPLALLMVALATPAAARSLKPAQNNPPPPAGPPLACTGPFAKDTTHAKLVAEFGEKNVAFKDVDTSGNILVKASVVFDGDPARRLVVFWKDTKARARPSSVLVAAPSTWTGPGSIHNGLSLKELEGLNGGPFSMTGFGGVGSGDVSGLKGPFVDLPGGCTLQVRLEPGIGTPLPQHFSSITGNETISSKNLVLRRALPKISAWSVNYP